MINTLARHLAAISEARRLIGLVLANNPAFGAFVAPDGRLPVGLAAPGELSNDCYFKAYCHLTDALAALGQEPLLNVETPNGCGAGDRVLDQIAAIAPCRVQSQAPPVAVRPNARCELASLSEPRGLATLRQRLGAVPDRLGTAPDRLVRAADMSVPVWTASGDEARVAIVRGGREAR